MFSYSPEGVKGYGARNFLEKMHPPAKNLINGQIMS